MCLADSCCTVSSRPMRILQLSSPNGTLAPLSSANSGVDQGCPLSTCGFSAAVDPVLRSVLADICTQYDSGAKLLCLPGRLVPVDQTAVPIADSRYYHSSHQISQPCSTVQGINPAPNIHEQFTIHNGYGKLRTSSRTTSTTLSTLRPIA